MGRLSRHEPINGFQRCRQEENFTALAADLCSNVLDEEVARPPQWCMCSIVQRRSGPLQK
jgi:hypothetical protein